MSFGGLLNIGQSALSATQSAINTIGNNIANVNTPGYSRQYVRFEATGYLNNKPGAQGQGVEASEILRHFNKFVENAFIGKSSVASRWNEQTRHMSHVESIFNESAREGVSSQMGKFFGGWETLSTGPDVIANRQSLIANADSLALLLRDSAESLKQMQDDMDSAIKYDVIRANQLIKDISKLNEQIDASHIEGVNNPNGLLDTRDQMTRELALLIDIKVDNKGGGNYFIQTKSGMSLVEGTEHYELAVLPPQAEFVPSGNSTYEGELEFSGTDSHEYTLKFINGGDVGDVPPPTFTVSLDGGKTFLRDDDGKVIEYEVTGTDDGAGNIIVDPIKVKNLEISFSESDNFTADDRFTIVPKDGLYWMDATRGAINITPQIGFDGTDNESRLTGGTLTALFNVRDDNCGRYIDEIDAVTKALIWETNYLHSQGAGLEKLDLMHGTESVLSSTVPLGSVQAGLTFGDKLVTGSMIFNIYDKETGAIMGDGQKALNFNLTGAGPFEAFDPEKHSLEDVQDAINAPVNFGGQLKASIVNGKLNIETDPDAKPPVNFHVVKDDSGVLAALGLNTFFKGTNANDMAVNTSVRNNLNLVNAGSLDGGIEVNDADAATANLLAKLADQNINISTIWKSSDRQTILEYYSSVVAIVGSDTRAAMTNKDYNIALATDLDMQGASISGVNLDEEMANLIKFQHSYTAAAKLITTADQMLQTLLGIKQ